MTSLPPPRLGTDQVTYAPDDDWFGHGPWVAMDDESVGTRFQNESDALAHWAKVHGTTP